MINAILQVNLPDHLRGRVMGLYGLTWELMPVAGLIAGAIAEYAGAPAAVVVGCDVRAEHAALGTVTGAMLRRHHRHKPLWLRKKRRKGRGRHESVENSPASRSDSKQENS